MATKTKNYIKQIEWCIIKNPNDIHVNPFEQTIAFSIDKISKNVAAHHTPTKTKEIP